MRLFFHRLIAALMGSWAVRQSTDGHLDDTCDGDVCKSHWAQMGTEIRNMVVSIYYDPFQPFKANCTYSCAPLVMVFHNLAAHLRWTHACAHLMGIQEGSSGSSGKVSRRAMFQLACDELDYLSLVGVNVYDSYKREHVR